jgi:DNA-binding Xre family transcriptional regulator
MEIELPYSILLNSTMSNAITIIATQILDSLERLKLCKSLDFNVGDLISEVRSFFKLNNCIQ